MKILLIEEEIGTADAFAALLAEHGFQTDIADNAEEGLDYAAPGFYDLILLNGQINAPGGGELVRKLRAERVNTPILMYRAKATPEERIAGLDAGADCVLSKSCDPGELMAWVNALLRRQDGGADVLMMGQTTLQLSSGLLSCGERSVRLSAREFAILRFLLQSKGNIVSKETILARVWGYDSNAVENHVEVYIGFLRKKLQAIGSDIRIVTLRRLGYCLEAAE